MSHDIMALLEADAIPSSRGRQALDIILTTVRELNEADLELLHRPTPQGSEVPFLTQIKHTHHLLARLLAAGRSAYDASVITGYSPAWISSLQRDPAFMELLAYYKHQADEVFLNVQERLAALCVTSIEELQERMLHQPESFSHKELMMAIEITGDRSVAPSKGQGKQAPCGSGNVTLNIAFVDPKERSVTIEHQESLPSE